MIIAMIATVLVVVAILMIVAVLVKVVTAVVIIVIEVIVAVVILRIVITVIVCRGSNSSNSGAVLSFRSRKTGDRSICNPRAPPHFLLEIHLHSISFSPKQLQ